MKQLLAVLANGPWFCQWCGTPFGSDAEGAAHMASAHPNLS